MLITSSLDIAYLLVSEPPCMDRHLATANDNEVKRTDCRAIEVDIKINRNKINLLKSKVSCYLSLSTIFIWSPSYVDYGIVSF